MYTNEGKAVRRRQMLKKTFFWLWMTVLFVLILPFGASEVEAADEWAGDYGDPETARTYEMDWNDGAGVAVGAYINVKFAPMDTSDGTPVINWTASNGNIRIEPAADMGSAKITGVSKGTAVVTVTKESTDGYGTPYIDTKDFTIEVTNPKLKESKIGLAIDGEAQVEVEGVSSYGADRVMYGTDGTNGFSVEKGGYVYGRKKQTRKVYVFADGKELTATVKVTDPTFRESYVVPKGKSVSYKVKGASGYKAVSYKVGNKKYATVTKSGQVKGKKYGKTTLTIQVDHAVWNFEIYISKNKVCKVVNKAHSICRSKPKYSQKNRMKKGYVDCSSFVWKAYKGGGVILGNKNWAMTAADLAKWCKKNHKLLKLSLYKNKPEKLKPGDLIFTKQGKNGRYKNISHVAMYIGNGKVLEAGPGSGVFSSQYVGWWEYNQLDEAVAIARPIK